VTLPFVLVRHGADTLPLLAGTDDAGQLVGLTVPGGDLFRFDPADGFAAMSADPAAVWWGLALD
jgi:hypothetical protein